jgi:RND superfamily putative drug exporter
MLETLGRTIARLPRTVAGIWLFVTLIAYGAALGLFGNTSLFDRLTFEAPVDPSSDSFAATQILAESYTGDTLAALVGEVDPSDTGISLAMQGIHTELAAMDSVESAVSPYILPGGIANPAAANLLARNDEGFVILVTVADSTPNTLDDLVTYLSDLTRALPDPNVTVQVGGQPLIADEVTNLVTRDLRTALLVALPVTALVTGVVLGGSVAALLPLAGAVATVGASLVTLLLADQMVQFNAALVLLVPALGFVLSITYGLLVAARFRSDLATTILAVAGRSRRRRRRDRVAVDALGRTLASCGKTVLISGGIVAVSLGTLAVFRPALLRTFAITGICAVFFATLSALTLVPALLAISGRAVLKPSPVARISRLLRSIADVDADDGWYAKHAKRVGRKPWVIVATVVLLLLLASPLTHLRTQNADMTVLPPENQQRVYLATLADQYPRATTPPVLIVADAPQVQANAWAQEVATLPAVESVTDAETLPNGFTTFGVYVPITDDPRAAEAAAVTDIRSLNPVFRTLVAGEAAELVDFKSALQEGLPWAVSIVLLGTGLLLWWMCGSIATSLRALLTTGLSVAAALGILVWGCQDGHLAKVFGFTSSGSVYLFLLALAVAISFGLSMTFEVVQLTQFRELAPGTRADTVPDAKNLVDAVDSAETGSADRDPAADGDEANSPAKADSADEMIANALQRTGPVITAAALIMVTVFLCFASSGLLSIKQMGLVLTAAVVVDVVLVRLCLAPVVKKFAIHSNWPTALRGRLARPETD